MRNMGLLTASPPTITTLTDAVVRPNTPAWAQKPPEMNMLASMGRSFAGQPGSAPPKPRTSATMPTSAGPDGIPGTADDERGYVPGEAPSGFAPAHPSLAPVDQARALIQHWLASRAANGDRLKQPSNNLLGE